MDKPVYMALGALVIQAKFQYSDRELVEQITENPYLQYFIGLPGYQDAPPFDASTLVLFRKRITADMLSEANEIVLGINYINSFMYFLLIVKDDLVFAKKNTAKSKSGQP